MAAAPNLGEVVNFLKDRREHKALHQCLTINLVIETIGLVMYGTSLGQSAANSTWGAGSAPELVVLNGVAILLVAGALRGAASKQLSVCINAAAGFVSIFGDCLPILIGATWMWGVLVPMVSGVLWLGLTFWWRDGAEEK